MNERVLLTGATGFLGHHLAAALTQRGTSVVTAGREGCDITLDLAEPQGFIAAIDGPAFDVVINCAAMSTMSACRRQPTLALKLNGKSPQDLASAAGCRFVQLSTDLVFDGDSAPYSAISTPRPLSVYGMSKAAAEAFEGAAWLVLRLPLLFGPSFDGRRGATDMLRAGVGAKEKVVLFTDEYRTPIHAADAAQGVVELALDRDVRGIRHVAGSERVSRWELCERFCAAVGIDVGAFVPGVSDDPRRPKDVSLIADWAPSRDLDAALAAS